MVGCLRARDTRLMFPLYFYCWEFEHQAMGGQGIDNVELRGADVEFTCRIVFGKGGGVLVGRREGDKGEDMVGDVVFLSSGI